MRVMTRKPAIGLLLATLALPISATLYAQEQYPASDGTDPNVVVTGMPIDPPTDLTGLEKGPEVKGFISARKGDRIQVTTVDGTKTVIAISDATQIKSGGGFLGLSSNKLASDSLLNGLPVTVETLQWSDGLVASKVDLKNKDLKTASMIRNGTEQGFTEQTAATEALKGRVANIDEYVIKGTTSVNFDTGKAVLSPAAQSDLCSVASQAQNIDNALLLVVGYTDNTGSQDTNQALSEKRAGRVVNYLQQSCGWKPYRMLTPTGMAEADPAADNSTPQGKAQNRRVTVNIMVSKAVDGI